MVPEKHWSDTVGRVAVVDFADDPCRGAPGGYAHGLVPSCRLRRCIPATCTFGSGFFLPYTMVCYDALFLGEPLLFSPPFLRISSNILALHPSFVAVRHSSPGSTRGGHRDHGLFATVAAV